MEAIIEARRHIDNAKGFLSNNGKKADGLYQDRKYVKIAGHTAYTGILIALDELLEEKKKKTRKSVEWYQKELSGLDKRITSDFATAYELLHISMGYDGTRSVDIAKLGLEKAEKVINWVENRLSNQKR
jgi:HEPN domain-containing protein